MQSSTEITLIDNKSEFHDLIEYPDGQKSIRLRLYKISKKHPVTIKCRIKDFSELEVLICLIEALRKNDYYLETISFAYLFGMRSDRAFSEGEPNYFRDVLAPIINSLEIPNVKLFLPHNEIVMKTINATLMEELPPFSASYSLYGDESSNFIERSMLFSQEHKSHNLGHFKKIRDKELGNITVALGEYTLLRLSRIDKSIPIILIDDLCDAGGTFIAAAKYLRDELKLQNELNLFVGHGLFTKGLDPLLEHFNKIICTNSYQNIEHPRVDQIKVI
jgi:ribose-phosphate pyrophosphokinase